STIDTSGSPITPDQDLKVSSDDNRAYSKDAPQGALVMLTAPVGEPGAIAPTVAAEDAGASGFPTCDAQLEFAEVQCSGLVPGAPCFLTRSLDSHVFSSGADGDGIAQFDTQGAAPPITGGDILTLQNFAGRALTALHVAHLRADLLGNIAFAFGGSCEPGDYY